MLTGLAMFRDNPILGVGFDNYTDNYWNYAGNLGLEASARNLTSERALREPHSLYIEILAETGLLGILAFLLFFGLIMKNIYQIRKTYRTRGSAPNEDWSAWITSTGISILTFLVAGFFLHGIGFRFIWVLAGMALSAINISKNKVFTNQLMNTK
jgi:O-antigen ligase